MRTDAISALFDAVADHAATVQMQTRRAPRWKVTVEDVPRGYRVAVSFDGEDVATVDKFGRQLESAARDAFESFEEWVADQPDEIARALEVTIAEHTAGGAR